MKGLTRVDHDGKKMYGWLVRAYGGGKTFSKYFSDKKYGGKSASREIAVAYLEKLTAEVNEKFSDFIPRQNQPGFRARPGTANASGLVGIHRCETVSRGRSVKYWAATWKEGRKPKDKTFYFGYKIRSEEEAKKLAIAWRGKKIIDISGESPLDDFKKSSRKKHQPGAPLISWVSGLIITDWSPEMCRNLEEYSRAIKKREPFTEKRVEELIAFLGDTAAHFDWKNIDYDFGRGIFSGDIRSRCLWNTDGYRTEILLDDHNRLLIRQGIQPDPYYLNNRQ